MFVKKIEKLNVYLYKRKRKRESQRHGDTQTHRERERDTQRDLASGNLLSADQGRIHAAIYCIDPE